MLPGLRTALLRSAFTGGDPPSRDSSSDTSRLIPRGPLLTTEGSDFNPRPAGPRLPGTEPLPQEPQCPQWGGEDAQQEACQSFEAQSDSANMSGGGAN